MLLAFVVACSIFSKDSDTANATSDADERPWKSAPVVGLSSGECPDMSVSGQTVDFLSSGEERTVTVVFPTTPQPEMRVVFFYHGLMDPTSTPNPTGYMANALNFQSLADEYNALIFLPESTIWNLAGQEFYLWSIEDGTYDNDLALFDDLRTCAHQTFEVDLDQLVSAGFSGGSLFNTILYSERSETLASVAEISGGADVEVPLYEELFAPYSTPEVSPPLLLISGGSNDLWPDAAFPIINFDSSTDLFQENVLGDGGFVVRCRHDSGHTITNKGLTVAIDWMTQHHYQEESPYTNDISSWSDWCEIP